MKPMIKLVSGLLLRTVAAPVVVTGVAAQATAKGIVHTGVALNNVGEAVELKGLQMQSDADGKIATSKLEMSQDKAERKARRREDAAQASSSKRAECARRVQELEMRRTMRRQLAEVDLTQLHAMATSGAGGVVVDVA
jgi:hypothetical protein